MEILESAARLQKLVPDAVLVGGAAAAHYAQHRLSVDHGHVVQDLRSQFALVLDALNREPDFLLNVSKPDVIVLGELGGIETGVRQLRRQRPLEVAVVDLPSGGHVRVPTIEEIIRIKAYLITRRNQTRDYLDIAALSRLYGLKSTAKVLQEINEYYADETHPDRGTVRNQVVRQLAHPEPKETRGFERLKRYKGLSLDWQDWGDVVSACQAIATNMAV